MLKKEEKIKLITSLPPKSWIETFKSSNENKHKVRKIKPKVKRRNFLGPKTGKYCSIRSNKVYFYKSKLEKLFMQYLDQTKNIVMWEYETVKIPLDNGRNYIPDFLVKYTDGNIELIEVKAIFAKDFKSVKYKQEAAIKFCKNCNWTYILLTPLEMSKFSNDLKKYLNNTTKLEEYYKYKIKSKRRKNQKNKRKKCKL